MATIPEPRGSDIEEAESHEQEACLMGQQWPRMAYSAARSN